MLHIVYNYKAKFDFDFLGENWRKEQWGEWRLQLSQACGWFPCRSSSTTLFPIPTWTRYSTCLRLSNTAMGISGAGILWSLPHLDCNALFLSYWKCWYLYLWSSKSCFCCCRYYLSLAHVASLFPGMLLMRTTSQSFSEACSTSVLRSTNAVLAVLCGVLVYDIIRFLGPSLTDRKATLMALVMTLYPLHWFFTFLYYTDVASLTAFLAMYLACLRKRYILSALVSHFEANCCFVVRITNLYMFIVLAVWYVSDFDQTNKCSVDAFRCLLRCFRLHSWLAVAKT